MSRAGRLVRAFLLVFRSFAFVRRHRLGRYFVIPGFLGLLLGTILAVLVFAGTNFLLERVADALMGPVAFLQPFLWFIALSQAMLFYILSWRFIASIVVLPSLGPLQDELERLSRGRRTETRFIDDAKNALFGGFKSLVQMGGFGLLSALALPLGPLESIPLLLYDAYFLGSGIFDAMLERDFPVSSARKRELRRMRPEMLGVGLAGFLLLLIPLFGIFASSGMGLVAAFRLRYGDEER